MGHTVLKKSWNQVEGNEDTPILELEHPPYIILVWSKKSMAQATVESIIPDNREAPSLSGRTGLLDHLLEQVTFFRVHLFAFTFIPLIFSGIFYASNGRYHVNYLDALFLCYSAMTVTGLSTIDLSTITGWQQAILHFLMTIVSTMYFVFFWLIRNRVISRSLLGSWFW